MEIPSDFGITFNEKPKMKALEIAEKARDAILSRKFHQVYVRGSIASFESFHMTLEETLIMLEV